MAKRKIWNVLKRWIVFVGCVALLGFPAFAEGAKTGYRTDSGEVVFLLDTSSSMNTQDRERRAVDAIRQAGYSLPTSYKTGLVAYGTEIQAVIPLSSGREQMETELESISYSGYTNAGEGLKQAVNLFTSQPDSPGCQSIVMLTDGEIDMPDKEARERSRALYTEAARQAKEKGIKIYIIAIGNELSHAGLHIFDGAELTDGAIYWSGQSGTLSQIMERILADRMGFPQIPVGAASGTGHIQVEYPSEGAEHIKVLLAADQEIQEVTADYPPESGAVITGRNFAVVEIEKPEGSGTDIYVQTPEPSKVRASMIVEYQVEPRTEITYRTEQALADGAAADGAAADGAAAESKAAGGAPAKDTVPAAYQHYADIIIRLGSADGRSQNIWDSPYYEGREIPFHVNGIPEKGVIEDGAIAYTLAIDGVNELIVEVDTDGYSELYEMVQPAPVALTPPPDPVPEPEPPDYRPLIGIIAVLSAAILILLVLWVRKKNTTVIYVAQPPAAGGPSKKMETKSCSYTGKFNLYVIRTADGRDVPPQTYRLFGRESGRMSLSQILASCKVKLGKIGAEDIIFYPGPDHSVIVMDQSERCTTLRGMEILKKGMGYPIFYGDKVTVTFEDETTEMEIHYKNLKPNEREG